MAGVLYLQLYCPPLAAEDERPERAVRAVEAVLSGESLSFTIEGGKGREPVRDRAAWLRRSASEGRFPIVCNDGDEGAYVGLSGVTWPGVIAPGGTDLLLVVCDLPATARVIERIEELLSELGSALNAFWGVAATPRAASLAHDQVLPPGAQGAPPFGLPALSEPRDVESPLVPLSLGFLNYWSASTVERLEFPNTAGEPEPFMRVRRLTDASWLLRLTEEPLDPERSDHRARLRAAYEALPAVGARDRSSLPGSSPPFTPTSSNVWLEAYASPLNGDIERLRRATQAVEICAGVALEWATEGEGERVAMGDRDRWFRQATAGDGATLPMLVDEQEDVRLFFAHDASFIGAYRPLYARCELVPPRLEGDAIEKLLAEFAQALEAFTAVVDSPASTGLALHQVVRPWHAEPPYGLPALHLPSELGSVLFPSRFGWMNYWSNETAAAVGFPTKNRTTEPFVRISQLSNRGWLLRLTEEPFDPERPDHLAKLLAAYERFPVVGGRPTPESRR